ncbi:hypothetical protein [Sphingomonas sp. PB2P12]|uniref:hypothetical protein n=1 Tax=Sphingomonas sandaracina TaxID=3096157 RepID=UPI002FC9420C
MIGIAGKLTHRCAERVQFGACKPALYLALLHGPAIGGRFARAEDLVGAFVGVPEKLLRVAGRGRADEG